MSVRRPIRWLPLALLALLAACTPAAPAPEADFGFALGETVFATTPGGSVVTSVAITPINGFTGTVAFALSDQGGDPADPGFELDPGSIVVSGASLVGPSIQRQLTIAVGAGVPLSTYELRLSAASGTIASDADLTLRVVPSLVPEIAITAPADGTTVTGSREVVLTGTLVGPDPIVAVDLLGDADLLGMVFDQSSFRATVELEDRANTLAIQATDDQGRVGVSPAITLDYPYLDLATFEAASVVIGQNDFVSGIDNMGGPADADTLAPSLGSPLVTDDGTLYLPDGDNNRILGFAAVPTASGAAADFVLGQPDFGSTAAGTGAGSFEDPASVATDGVRLIVSDNDNHRVLIWNALPTGPTPADVAIGQPDFASNASACSATGLDTPEASIVAAGRVIVADRNNNRVLIWNDVPATNGEPADVVLGQGSFTTCTPNDDDQDGADDGAPSGRTLNFVTGVWSDGERLIVTDSGNNRVLVWDQIPTTSFTPADRAIGQPDLVSAAPGTDERSLLFPRQVASNGNQLFVLDAGNHRVLVFDQPFTQKRPRADRVLGQALFGSGVPNDDDQDGISDGVPSARSMNIPYGIALTAEALLVQEDENNRVLIFEVP